MSKHEARNMAHSTRHGTVALAGAAAARVLWHLRVDDTPSGEHLAVQGRELEPERYSFGRFLGGTGTTGAVAAGVAGRLAGGTAVAGRLFAAPSGGTGLFRGTGDTAARRDLVVKICRIQLRGRQCLGPAPRALAARARGCRWFLARRAPAQELPLVGRVVDLARVGGAAAEVGDRSLERVDSKDHSRVRLRTERKTPKIN